MCNVVCIPLLDDLMPENFALTLTFSPKLIVFQGWLGYQSVHHAQYQRQSLTYSKTKESYPTNKTGFLCVCIMAMKFT